MAFNPNIPQPGDKLSKSQSDLLINMGQLDALYGEDHFPFSDATLNSGFHDKVTTPIYVADPPTSLPPVTTTNPVFYGWQQTVPVGILQFSRGPNDAVPSPLTRIHSTVTAITLAPLSSSNVLDCTGLSRAFFRFYVMDTVANVGQSQDVFWTGTTFILASIAGTLKAQPSGNVLQVANTSAFITYSSVYWTLELLRIS